LVFTLSAVALAKAELLVFTLSAVALAKAELLVFAFSAVALAKAECLGIGRWLFLNNVSKMISKCIDFFLKFF
jgi:hypothetical protein